MIIELVTEARANGARLGPCCEVLELDPRTVQRWLKHGPDGGEDGRHGPRTVPANKLTAAERQQVLDVMNSPEFADLPPQQVVPLLADLGIYVAFRVHHLPHPAGGEDERTSWTCKASSSSPSTTTRGHGPQQVWCWDITYLKSPVRGEFFYLYLFLDVWSRMIVGWAVEEQESNERAAELFRDICDQRGIDPSGLVLHSDNGGPMKGSTMLATLQSLGVVASFSRPSVSNDNPFAEAIFRTCKYRPDYPDHPFASLAEAQAWVAGIRPLVQLRAPA